MIPKKQIRVEKWKAPKDAKGDAKEVVEVAYTLWAEPVKSGGNINNNFGQTKHNNQVRFKIRFRPDWKINSAWKIIYLGQRYTITNIERIDEKRFNWIINGEN